MGWFSKKNPPAEPESADDIDADDRSQPGVTSAALSPLVQRWDAAIAGAYQRLDQILAEATAASEQLLPTLGTDFGPLTRLWTVAQAKVHQQTEAVSDGWDSISDEMSEVEDLPEDEMDRQGYRRDEAVTELEIRYTRANRAAMARAAEQMRQQVAGDPGAMRMFAASGALMLGQWEGQAAWETMTRAENRINQYRESRDVPLELLREYQASAQQYWTTTLTVEAQHAPELQQYVAAKIERYMKDVERVLRQHWQWRQQGS